MTPLLSYEDIRQVAVFLWILLCVLSLFAWDYGDKKAKPPRWKGPQTYCRQHNKMRSECESEHRP